MSQGHAHFFFRKKNQALTLSAKQSGVVFLWQIHGHFFQELKTTCRYRVGLGYNRLPIHVLDLRSSKECNIAISHR